ncbi:MAG: T9SS type A sorting domain-containing protein [Bacteroidales bacterium]|nr:T9SS type A sorting domain-containing protein [Bacteroidales bacterium]
MTGTLQPVFPVGTGLEARGGIWQETWATRCLDNNSVTFAGLHIIEGIYGRDGNFLHGPTPDDLATDYMTNYIIFGRNQFYVDIIGHYLGAHEPGNFGLFHMALERGMITTINPRNIPVYEWDKDTGPSLANLTSFERFPLKTYYLQRDFDGQNEPYWHLVNEPYIYGTTGVNNLPDSQESFYLKQNFPNPVRNSTSLTFHIPGNGDVDVEILNNGGQVIETLVSRQLTYGDHTFSWNSSKYSPGIYICRVNWGGSFRTTKMLVYH